MFTPTDSEVLFETTTWANKENTTVEPRSTDTRLIRTPGYYGQFRLSRRKVHIFSLK